jgi:hypothetical protein
MALLAELAQATGGSLDPLRAWKPALRYFEGEMPVCFLKRREK